MRKQQSDSREKQWKKTKVDISKQNLKTLSRTYQRAFLLLLISYKTYKFVFQRLNFIVFKNWEALKSMQNLLKKIIIMSKMLFL